MKYIIGASIGGLFGLGIPLAIGVKDTLMIEHDESPRIEVPQHAEEELPIPIENSMTLPDTICGYISYESEDIKEQAKECLKQSLPALPAIQYVDIINLEPGGVIIDHKTGEVGLLMRRYDIIEHLPLTLDLISDHDEGLWAWEILWSGSEADKNNRYFPYTETGLCNMIRAGTFEYIECVKK